MEGRCRSISLISSRTRFDTPSSHDDRCPFSSGSTRAHASPRKHRVRREDSLYNPCRLAEEERVRSRCRANSPTDIAAVAFWRKRDTHPDPSAWGRSISGFRQLLGPDFVAHDGKEPVAAGIGCIRPRDRVAGALRTRPHSSGFDALRNRLCQLLRQRLGLPEVASSSLPWMTRNPNHPVTRVLARPRFEFQRRFSTAEPSHAQVEVADAARDACLARER
jgi:hypothetical protein